MCVHVVFMRALTLLCMIIVVLRISLSIFKKNCIHTHTHIYWIENTFYASNNTFYFLFQHRGPFSCILTLTVRTLQWIIENILFDFKLKRFLNFENVFFFVVEWSWEWSNREIQIIEGIIKKKYLSNCQRSLIITAFQVTS